MRHVLRVGVSDESFDGKLGTKAAIALAEHGYSTRTVISLPDYQKQWQEDFTKHGGTAMTTAVVRDAVTHCRLHAAAPLDDFAALGS